MAIIRWQPFTEVDNFRQEMDRLFDTFLAPNPKNHRSQNGLAFVPAAEMTETDNDIQLQLEMPGLKPEDVNIEITADSVTVSGERKSETKSEDNGITRSEIRYGSFHRVIPLPVHVNNTNVTAEYKDGVLNLLLPKKEEEKDKVVKVSLA